MAPALPEVRPARVMAFTNLSNGCINVDIMCLIAGEPRDLP